MLLVDIDKKNILEVFFMLLKWKTVSGDALWADKAALLEVQFYVAGGSRTPELHRDPHMQIEAVLGQGWLHLQILSALLEQRE